MMRIRKILYIISISLIIPFPVYGDIYQWVDESGIIHFANTPPDKKSRRVLKEDKEKKSKNNKTSESYRSISTVRYQDYSGLIETISGKYQIDPALVKAVIITESNFKADAISKKGARGLMQLMPQTANELNVRNSFDPEENIEGGVRYLKYLLGIFNGDLPLSLAAYNAGPELVQKLGRVPSIKETRDYVKRVLGIYNGPRKIDIYKTPIYGIILDDGTVLFTNTPYNYNSEQRSIRKM